MTMVPLSALSTGLQHVHINIIHLFVVVHIRVERSYTNYSNYSPATVSSNSLFYIRTTLPQIALKSAPHSFLYSQFFHSNEHG